MTVVCNLYCTACWTQQEAWPFTDTAEQDASACMSSMVKSDESRVDGSERAGRRHLRGSCQRRLLGKQGSMGMKHQRPLMVVKKRSLRERPRNSSHLARLL